MSSSETAPIWIDVTDLVAWSRTFTGTQRVTFELSVRLARSTRDVRFFRYDADVRRLIVVPPDDVLHHPSASAPAARRTAGSRRPSARRPQDIRLLGELRSAGALPLARWAYRWLRWVVKNIAFRRSGTLASQGEAEISNGSLVLLLGMPWNEGGLIGALEEVRTRGDVRFVHLVHDMIPCFSPHVFPHSMSELYGGYMRRALALSDTVVCVSRSTARDVTRFCEREGIPTPAISVTRLGDTFDADLPATRPDGIPDGPFLLTVGTIEARKNHGLLYTVYKKAAVDGLALPPLVIVGGAGWLTADLRYAIGADPDVNTRMLILTGIDDSELSWLYRNCRFTVYPSVYEGWGLPIAESLAHGKLCLASHSSSMTEIAGELIEYFSPYDPQRCLELMLTFLDDDALRDREQRIAAGYEPVTWESTYESVRRALGDV